MPLTLTTPISASLCPLIFPSSALACAHTDRSSKPELNPPNGTPPQARREDPLLRRPPEPRPSPTPNLEGAPSPREVPGSGAFSAGSRRHPFLSGSRAGRGTEGCGQGSVLLLPQWRRPCSVWSPGREHEGQQPPGERRAAAGTAGTLGCPAGGTAGNPPPRQRPRA